MSKSSKPPASKPPEVGRAGTGKAVDDPEKSPKSSSSSSTARVDASGSVELAVSAGKRGDGPPAGDCVARVGGAICAAGEAERDGAMGGARTDGWGAGFAAADAGPAVELAMKSSQSSLAAAVGALGSAKAE